MKRSAVRLTEVVGRLRGAGLLAAAPESDPLVSGVQEDSRRVGPGDLFCTWAGTESDGHRFVPAAESAGAVAAVVERPVTESHLPQVIVTDGRRGAAVAAALVFGDPADELRLFGVTGTNGKTTTVWILRHLLAVRWSAASMGTLGILVGDDRPSGDESLTTPGPVEVARTLRELVESGIDAVAAEVSSHALEQGRVHGVAFDVAVFLNLSRDHLDYHGTVEAYLEAKRTLVDRLRQDGVAVVNLDDPAWEGLSERAPRVLTYSSCGARADVCAGSPEPGPFGVGFRLETAEGGHRVALPLLGGYNVQNALAAAAACLAVGFEAAEVAERLATVPQVPGRLERVSDTPCPVLIDYAHTPDAMERVLSTLRPLVPRRLILVFGAGGDRDPGKRPLMGAVAARWADITLVTSDNPRTEDPESIVDDILAGAPGAGFVREVERRQAIGRALRMAGAGDVVLLAGKGHETYQVVGREKLPFDEREIVKEWLERLEAEGAE